MSHRPCLALFASPLLGLCMAPAAAQESTAVELDAVEVVGRRDSGGYAGDETYASKTQIALRKLPQSVRILTRQVVDDLGATRVDGTLDYVGGISRQNNYGGLWDNFAVRGLPGNENTGSATLLNGLSGNRGYQAPRDTANVERIEFLKGPAAALYGSSEPGGTLNVVTKLPQWRAGTAVEVYGGSHDSGRVALDSTGPLGEAVAYRLNAAFEDKGSFRDHVGVRRDFLAPALTWKLGVDTTLDYTGEWLRHRTPLDRGTVAVAGKLGVVSRRRFLGEPGDGDITVQNQNHQLVLRHRLSETWRYVLAGAYRRGSLQGYSTEPTAVQADDRTLWRQRRFRNYHSEDLAAQAELHGTLQTGQLHHQVLVGVEAYDFSLDQQTLRARPTAAAPYALDLFAPRYGQATPWLLPFVDTRETQRNLALYLQDALSLDQAGRWTLLVGLRHDRYQQTLQDHRTGGRYGQEPSRTTPRVGVSFAPDAQWSLYFNAGSTFRPNSGSDVWYGTGTRAAPAPESGRALELGAKWQAPDGRMGATMALFEIEKKNVLTGDPLNAGNQIAAGQVRSRGAEFDLSGQLGEHWRVNASLSFTDVQVTRDNTLHVGGSLINVPRWNGSLLAVREQALGQGALGWGGGMTYTGERLAEAYTQAQADAGIPARTLPAYCVAKLVGYWRLNPRLRLSLDVDNVFDRTYYTSSVAATPWVAIGAARTVTAGVQYRF